MRFFPGHLKVDKIVGVPGAAHLQHPVNDQKICWVLFLNPTYEACERMTQLSESDHAVPWDLS